MPDKPFPFFPNCIITLQITKSHCYKKCNILYFSNTLAFWRMYIHVYKTEGVCTFGTKKKTQT